MPREACLGGIDSACHEGHEGVLCARCKEGFYTPTYGETLCREFPGGRNATLYFGPSTMLVLAYSGSSLGTFLFCFCIMLLCYRRAEDEEDVLPPWEDGTVDHLKLDSDIASENELKHRKSPRSKAKAAEGFHVWIHHEVDGAYGWMSHALDELCGHSSQSKRKKSRDMAFCQELEMKLTEWNLSVCVEPEERAQAESTLRSSAICIFNLSTHFFDDERTLSLLRLAVEEKKTVVMVVMPMQRWGGKADKTFPENAFNPTWKPFCPDVAPAFAEIAVTWESEYPEACLEELLKRVSSHLTRLTGQVVVDMDRMRKVLAENEEQALLTQAKQMPSEVELAWAWDLKVFDVFLSHKITDAKDIVLTWFNALSALGYHPFLDRLSLDAVENIPLYVEQTVTFGIAVTSNLWQSYWCAIELITAVQLHMAGKLNILLIPIQGERFKIPDGEMRAGVELDFPTPEIMMQNFGKWFASNELCPDEAKAGIIKLYGGGNFTQCRLIKHTLMHYKSFERLFIARCGTSIKSHKMMEEFIAAGGMTMAEVAERVMPLIFEANTLRQQNGEKEFYEARIRHNVGAMGYETRGDLSSQELVIAELLPGDATDGTSSKFEVASLDTQEFADLVRNLRADHQSLGEALRDLALDGIGVVDQFRALAETGNHQYIKMAKFLKSALKPLQEALKNVLATMQIGLSFLLTFGGIDFPPVFSALANMFGFVNFDFLSLELIQALIAAEVNFCGVAVGMGVQLTTFLASIPFAFWLICALKRPTPGKRAEFFDYSIFLAVITCFVVYPTISLRIMKIFKTRTFGQHIVMEADWRISIDDPDYAQCRMWGGVFIFLYVLGIPAIFFGLLWVYARPLNTEVHITDQRAEKAVRAEQTALRRFGILYQKYLPECWWWELLELIRKAVLTGGLIFIRPGTVSQIWASLLIAMIFLLAVTFFTPYRDFRDTFVTTVCQLCTFLTLLCILALRTNLDEEGLLSTGILNAALIVLMVLPLLLAAWLFHANASDLLQARRQMLKNLPAILKDEGPDEKAPPRPSLLRRFCRSCCSCCSRCCACCSCCCLSLGKFMGRQRVRHCSECDRFSDV